LAEEVEQQEGYIEQLASRVNAEAKKKPTSHAVKFFIVFQLVAIALGLTKNALHEYLKLPRNATLRHFLESKNDSGTIPARSWLYRRLRFVEELVGGEILYLALEVKRAVDRRLSRLYLNTALGLQSRSKERMGIDTAELLRYLDFSKYVPWGKLKLRAACTFEKMLRAITYLYLVPLASFNKLLGDLRAVHVFSSEAVQWLSVKLGFFEGPPGKTRLNQFFRQLDVRILHAIQRDLLHSMVEMGLVDTIVVSLDSTCIAAQKNDPDKKEGVSTRGHFDGFKLHLGVSNGGQPIFMDVTTGEKADGDYAEPFCRALRRLRRRFPWLKVEFADLDGGYDWLKNIKAVEGLLGGAVPVIDINPGRSKLLKKLKDKGNELAKLSKKALEDGGLDGKDREAYESLHEAVAGITRQIEEEGTPSELAKAFNGMVYASITWFLVYHRRAVVEGVFGIMRKLLGLTGQGQKQPHFKGLDTVRKHCLLIIIAMNLRAIGNHFFTGRKAHLLESPHNWKLARAVA